MMQDKSLRLRVERMAYGADAIAHDAADKTVFVSGAVAGDEVEATIVKEDKAFSHAVATKVLEPSPSRVTPTCPYAGTCGGCPWATLSRPAQLEAKRANVVDSLTRIAHMDKDVAEQLVEACEAPSEAWGYRNKVELAFERRGSRVAVGMHTATTAKDKPSVIKVDSCPLLNKRYQKLVKSVSGALSYLSGSSNLDIERVGIRASSHTRDIEIALWTTPGPFPRSKAAKVLTDATKASSVVRVMTKGPSKARKVAGVEVLSGKGHWSERVGNETMMLSAPSFFQVNTAGAQRLIELVTSNLKPTPDDVAMDLYSGAGTFTLPLARSSAWVYAVEAYGPAVRDLRRNLDAADVFNADPIGGDADREFPDDEASIIVVDPPRAGLAADVVRKLSRQPARAIAYVSCDPATLARDIGRFVAEGTFMPTRITPVDLFPQTFHVETVVLLTRKS